MQTIVTEKKCSRCHRVRPVSEFYPDKRKKSGTVSRCKSCAAAEYDNRREYQRQYNQEYYRRFPEKFTNPEKLRKWRQDNPDKTRVYAYRRRTRNQSGNITPQEWQALCKFYGHKCLACNRTNVKLTLDHVVPLSKGGPNKIENAQPLCGSCNSRKGTKTIDYRPRVFVQQ